MDSNAERPERKQSTRRRRRGRSRRPRVRLLPAEDVDDSGEEGREVGDAPGLKLQEQQKFQDTVDHSTAQRRS
jgi:hypothetical protein